jgi:hypothetical protein
VRSNGPREKNGGSQQFHYENLRIIGTPSTRSQPNGTMLRVMRRATLLLFTLAALAACRSREAEQERIARAKAREMIEELEYRKLTLVDLSSDPPGAEVTVGGGDPLSISAQERPRTTPLQLALEAGTHTIELRKERFATESLTITVGAEGGNVRRHVLLRSSGAAQISPPGTATTARGAAERACPEGQLELAGPWEHEGARFWAAAAWKEGARTACLVL